MTNPPATAPHAFEPEPGDSYCRHCGRNRLGHRASPRHALECDGESCDYPECACWCHAEDG